MQTLYICYFGIGEPLVQTQVLPYLRELMRDGIEVRLLTFEPQLKRREGSPEFERTKAALAEEGIHWICLPYHKRPSLPATLFDIVAGARLAARLVRRYGADVIHARSHVPAAMALIAKRLAGGLFLFDIRGFMAEEYVDAGIWPARGYLYRLTKAAERRLLKAADGFVVLTDRAREILFNGTSATDLSGRPVEVIPCCVDLQRFEIVSASARDEIRSQLAVGSKRVFVYVGALGGWYLTNEMVDLLVEAHRQNATTFSLILTQSPVEMVTEQLMRQGLSEQDYLVRKVSPTEIPHYLAAADIAVSFIKPCYSKLASSPTKIAEYLASGLPLICNSGIGDLDDVIETDRVGVLLHDFNQASYEKALGEIDILSREADLAARCRASAYARFDLHTVGGKRYRRLYRHLRAAAKSPN